MAEDVENKKGMWNGKHGLSAGCEVNAQSRKSNYDQLLADLNNTFEFLRYTESIIDEIGEVLSLSQPKMGVGKLGVRWWSNGRSYRYIEPYLVRWKLQANKVMTPVLAIRTRSKKSDRFLTNFKERQQLLEILSNTFERRSALKNRIDNCRKALSGLDDIYIKLETHEIAIKQLRIDVLRNLVDEGYEIEARYRPLLDEGS